AARARRGPGDDVHDPLVAALSLVFRLADRLCLPGAPLGAAVADHRVFAALPGRRLRLSAGPAPARDRNSDLRAIRAAGAGRSLVSSTPRRHREQPSMSVSVSAASPPDPNRYFEHIAAERGAVAEAEPVCLYLETTNRCNLLCTTCPRTFEALEPPADMSWEL